MRGLVVLALVCAALALGVALTPGRASAPEPEVVRVVDHLRTRDEPVAGLSLAFGVDTPPFVFVRSRGQWRCLSVWNAPADGARIEALLGALVDAGGVVRAGASDGGWGLDGEDTLVLELHGRKLLDDPDGDVLLSARFGKPSLLAGVSRARSVGSFARLGDDSRVLELALEPTALVGTSTLEGLPPLLAMRVAPPAFPGAGGPVERVFVERADGSALELVRSAREPQLVEPGMDPNLALEFAWDLVDAEGTRAIPPLRGEAFATWTPRAPYDLLADPREFAAFGLERPDVRLTLVPTQGEALVLELSAADALGRRWVLCRGTPQLARVGPDVARMLTPDATELSDSSRPNAWDAWLRAELSRR
ncbi:MAG TPA: hypothetical protein VMT18_07690 [Planctomycetota bacterium]|nr:hypothetical protein [Planctomycetota bacterium]